MICSCEKEFKTEKTKSRVKNAEIAFIVVEIGYPKLVDSNEF
jgi:hypothetical protein